MQIVLTAKERDTLISEVMQNFPEASSYSVVCQDFDYDRNEYKFLDAESGKVYKIGMPQLRDGMDKLMQIMSQGELKGISCYVLPDVLDAGNWDADAADALVQCAIFKEVIYG